MESLLLSLHFTEQAETTPSEQTALKAVQDHHHRSASGRQVPGLPTLSRPHTRHDSAPAIEPSVSQPCLATPKSASLSRPRLLKSLVLGLGLALSGTQLLVRLTGVLVPVEGFGDGLLAKMLDVLRSRCMMP